MKKLLLFIGLTLISPALKAETPAAVAATGDESEVQVLSPDEIKAYKENMVHQVMSCFMMGWMIESERYYWFGLAYTIRLNYETIFREPFPEFS